MKPKYKRVLLKLSGEALLPEGASCGVCLNAAGRIAKEIKDVAAKGVQVALVIGGGNIFRGAVAAQTGSIGQAQADSMGMLATVINGLALQEGLEKLSCCTTLMTSIAMQNVARSFVRRDAVASLKEGNVVIFAGGTGNPFFSTDTAASLRALEIGADVLIKGTKVDGVYSADPCKDKSATKFDKLSYIDVISKRLKVMDLTAISMCMDHKLPVIVFNVFESGSLMKVVSGENRGTLIYG